MLMYMHPSVSNVSLRTALALDLSFARRSSDIALAGAYDCVICSAFVLARSAFRLLMSMQSRSASRFKQHYQPTKQVAMHHSCFDLTDHLLQIASCTLSAKSSGQNGSIDSVQDPGECCAVGGGSSHHDVSCLLSSLHCLTSDPCLQRGSKSPLGQERSLAQQHGLLSLKFTGR